MTPSDAYKVTGPKGGTIAPHTPAGKLGKLLPGWVKRYRQVKVSKATSAAPKPKLTERQLIVQWWHWAIANAARIGYAEVRPIPRVAARVLPRLPFRSDCSGTSVMSYAYGGAKDPSGNGFNGRGYTGDVLHTLKRTTLAKLKLGDTVVFGCKSIPAGHHMGVVIAIHSRTYAGVVIGSHGSANGPLAITIFDEAKYQPDGLAGVVLLTDPTLN